MIEIPFFVDFENVEKAGANLEKVLSKAAKKAGEGVRKPLKKATRGINFDLEKVAKKAEEFAGIGGKVARIPLPGFAILGDAVDRIGQGFSALTSPAGLAIVAIGGVVAIAASAAAAVGLAAVAIVGLVAGSEALLETVKELDDIEGLGVSKEDTAALATARAGLDAVAVVAAQAALELASQWAPAIERVTTLLLAFGLAGVDAFQNARGAVSSFTDLVVQSAVDAVTAYNPFFLQIEKIVQGLESMGAVSKGTAKAFRESTEAIVTSGATVAVEALDTAFGGLELSTGQYLTRARELVARQAEVNSAVEGTVKVFLTAAEGFKFLADAQSRTQELLAQFEVDREGKVQAINRAYEEQAEEIRDLIDLGGDQVKLEALLRDLTIERNQELAVAQDQTDQLISKTDRWSMAMDAGTKRARVMQSSIADAAGGFSDLFSTIAEGSKKELKGLFIASKILAIAQIQLQGSVATIRAFAELGPIAGAITAAGVVASTISASLSTARSVSAEFARGGVADGRGSPRVAATLEDQEGVLNTRAMDLLGRTNFDALNEGRAPGTQRGGRAMPVRFRDRELAHMIGRVFDGANELGDRVREMGDPVGVLNWTV